MKVMLEVDVDVGPRGMESASTYGAFDEAKLVLNKGGYRIITLLENVDMRIQRGLQSTVSSQGNFVFNDVVYTPGGIPKLTIGYSPIVENAVKATQAHRKGEEFELSGEQFEKSVENSIDFPMKYTNIPVAGLSENKFVVTALGDGDMDRVRDYAKLLRGSEIENFPVFGLEKEYVDRQAKPFARKLWFGSFNYYWSKLDGSVKYINFIRRVRGIRDSSCEVKK